MPIDLTPQEWRLIVRALRHLQEGTHTQIATILGAPGQHFAEWENLGRQNTTIDRILGQIGTQLLMAKEDRA